MKLSGLAWIVAVLLFLSTAINYADRLTLSIVSRMVRGELHMNEQQYSYVGTAFLVAYAIMYAGSGYLVDRMSTRLGFAVFMFGWSVAQMLHAWVAGPFGLGVARFLLGLAEPANWPAGAKAVSEWFPARLRALGIGIMNAGSSVGSAVAPPLIAAVTGMWGWRAAFVVTGLAGLIWLVLWLMLYQTPPVEPAGPPDRRHLGPPRAGAILRRRECYTLIIARFFTDPVIYFVVFWLPEYLGRERGFDLAAVGAYAWIPFAFGGLGYVAGGWLSGHLMRCGWTLPRSRKFVMALGAAVMPAAIVAPLAPSAGLAIAAMCFVTWGHALWVANLQTLPTDLFRAGEVGSASGFTGMGGAIGGALANLGTGWVVMHYSYAPVFAAAGVMHPLSAAVVYWLLPDRCFHSSPEPETARTREP